MTSYTMADDSVLTADQIEGRIRNVEYHLDAIRRLETILGPLLVDYESVRLNLAGLRRDFPAEA